MSLKHQAADREDDHVTKEEAAEEMSAVYGGVEG